MQELDARDEARYEKETVLRHDELDNVWHVYAARGSRIDTILRRLFAPIRQDEHGAHFKLSRACILIRAQPRKRTLSPERLKQCIENLKRGRTTRRLPQRVSDSVDGEPGKRR